MNRKNLLQVKNVVRKLYDLDFERNDYKLNDGEEIVVNLEKNTDEFRSTLRLVDTDNGIIVTPSGYVRGFVYKKDNGGEMYNHPSWIPDMISFKFNVLGLKRGSFYRVTVVGRNVEGGSLVTDDRTIKVTSGERDLLIDDDFTADRKNRTTSGIFRASTNEMDLYFTLGKIFINDIIIEEVELLIADEYKEETDKSRVFGPGKMQVASYGVFSTHPLDEGIRYEQMHRYAGLGINLYFDTVKKEYVIERDNRDDLLGEPFTNVNYMVDINLNKVVSKNEFSQYNIVDVSPEMSPNTLKQGHIRFEFADADDNKITYSKRDGRIYIIIYRLN